MTSFREIVIVLAYIILVDLLEARLTLGIGYRVARDSTELVNEIYSILPFFETMSKSKGGLRIASLGSKTV